MFNKVRIKKTEKTEGVNKEYIDASKKKVSFNTSNEHIMVGGKKNTKHGTKKNKKLKKQKKTRN
jgi:hypothetical protein